MCEVIEIGLFLLTSAVLSLLCMGHTDPKITTKFNDELENRASTQINCGKIDKSGFDGSLDEKKNRNFLKHMSLNV